MHSGTETRATRFYARASFRMYVGKATVAHGGCDSVSSTAMRTSIPVKEQERCARTEPTPVESTDSYVVRNNGKPCVVGVSRRTNSCIRIIRAMRTAKTLPRGFQLRCLQGSYTNVDSHGIRNDFPMSDKPRETTTSRRQYKSREGRDRRKKNESRKGKGKGKDVMHEG